MTCQSPDMILPMQTKLSIKNKTNKLRDKPKYLLGKRGEAFALKYLQKNGFEILQTNFRGTGFEIDIIARKKRCLHFVEVKYRKSYTGSAWQFEQLNMDKKLGFIKRGAHAYLRQGQNKRLHEIHFKLFVINERGKIWEEQIA